MPASPAARFRDVRGHPCNPHPVLSAHRVVPAVRIAKSRRTALVVDSRNRTRARMRAARAPTVRTVIPNASAEADLLADRVPLFASAWLVLVAVITIIEMLQGRLEAGLALAFLALHAAILGAAVLWRAT